MLAIILIIVFVVWLGVSSFVSWYRLRAFPGPLVAAISKLWIVKGILHKDLHLELKRVCDEYGMVELRLEPLIKYNTHTDKHRSICEGQPK